MFDTKAFTGYHNETTFFVTWDKEKQDFIFYTGLNSMPACLFNRQDWYYRLPSANIEGESVSAALEEVKESILSLYASGEYVRDDETEQFIEQQLEESLRWAPVYTPAVEYLDYSLNGLGTDGLKELLQSNMEEFLENTDEYIVDKDALRHECEQWLATCEA